MENQDESHWVQLCYKNLGVDADQVSTTRWFDTDVCNILFHIGSYMVD